MPYLDSVEELLEAKEGEHVQFKEAKNRFDFGEAARCCCALANDGGGAGRAGHSGAEQIRQDPRTAGGSET